jgi:hypothetical protein
LEDFTMKKLSPLFASLSATLLLALSSSAFAVGAIAVDDEVGESDPGYGYVTGMDSEAEAKKGAMKECRANGNQNCKVVVWFKQCGAYANSRKYAGTGFGATKKVAEARALDECGNAACKIIVSDCE